MLVLLAPILLFSAITISSVASRLETEATVLSVMPGARSGDRAEPMESLILCARACDVMSGLDDCVAECNERLWECVNCCLVSNASATTGHCRAVCVDDLTAFACKL